MTKISHMIVFMACTWRYSLIFIYSITITIQIKDDPDPENYVSQVDPAPQHVDVQDR